MSPEKFTYLEDVLFEHGAIDVFKTSIVMKKGRLATKLSILTDIVNRDNILAQLFRHSTTIGARVMNVQKYALDRHYVFVDTDYGSVQFKVSYLNDEPVTVKPEYEDIKLVALNGNMSLIQAEKLATSKYDALKGDIFDTQHK